MKTELIQTIQVAGSGSVWLDLTNNCVIGRGIHLVKYVNKHKLTVKNEQTVQANITSKFWYNI